MMAPMVFSLIASMVSPLLQNFASSVINVTSKQGVMRAWKRQQGGFLLLLAFNFNDQSSGKKESQKQEKNIA